MNTLLTYAGQIVTIVLAIAILRALIKIMMDEKKKKEEKKTVSFEAATPGKNTKVAPMTLDDTNAGEVPWTNMDPKKGK